MVNIADSKKWLQRLSLTATLLAFIVVLVGAYTRLGDAGLGCPDWPVCYGQITVPHTPDAIKAAAESFPGQTVEAAKAWKEMIHRYLAGTLGLLIFVIVGLSFYRRRIDPTQKLLLPTLLFLGLIWQAMLGMWTVTLKLLPLVVMGHLLGGMTILALLWTMTITSRKWFAHTPEPLSPSLRRFSVIALVIVVMQIFLGGWTSANYASIVCADFPMCQGSLFPHMDFMQGFNFLSPIGANYEGGLLETPARIAIQMTHRYGALITTLILASLAFYFILFTKQNKTRYWGLWLLIVLLIQIVLGILNVELLLPLPIAVAHNGIAALILLTIISFIFKIFSATKREAHDSRH